MQISERGIEFTAQQEGFRAEAYPDGGGWSIGYGHHGPEVCQGQSCTEADARKWLRGKLEQIADVISQVVKVPLTQSQFDALCDFTYNVGIDAFEHSTLLRLLNLGNYATAAVEFGVWVYSGSKKIDALVKRRAAEKALFLSDASLKAGATESVACPSCGAKLTLTKA